MKKYLLSIVFAILSFFNTKIAFAEMINNDLLASTSRNNLISKEVNCLAKAIYFESKGGSPNDMRDVAHVVLNRTNSSRFPSDVCSVVYQRSPRVCQFSWTCNPHSIREHKEYEKSVAYATELLEKEKAKVRRDTTNGALFFRVTRNTSNACHINKQHAFFR